MGCFILHKWDGCKCSKCGKTRNSGHDWQYGIYCKKCHQTGDLDRFDPFPFTKMPLAEFWSFIRDLTWKVLVEEKKTYATVSQFFPNSSMSKDEYEKLQKLMHTCVTLITMYMSRIMNEKKDKSKAFDELIQDFSMGSEQHLGKYNTYGPQKATNVLTEVARSYVESIRTF